MTILLEILKNSLIPQIKNIIKEAQDSDKGWTNYLANMTVGGRIPELSQFKQDQTKKLQEIIDSFEDKFQGCGLQILDETCGFYRTENNNNQIPDLNTLRRVNKSWYFLHTDYADKTKPRQQFLYYNHRTQSLDPIMCTPGIWNALDAYFVKYNPSQQIQLRIPEIQNLTEDSLNFITEITKHQQLSYQELVRYERPQYIITKKRVIYFNPTQEPELLYLSCSPEDLAFLIEFFTQAYLERQNTSGSSLSAPQGLPPQFSGQLVELLSPEQLDLIFMRTRHAQASNYLGCQLLTMSEEAIKNLEKRPSRGYYIYTKDALYYYGVNQEQPKPLSFKKEGLTLASLLEKVTFDRARYATQEELKIIKEYTGHMHYEDPRKASDETTCAMLNYAIKRYIQLVDAASNAAGCGKGNDENRQKLNHIVTASFDALKIEELLNLPFINQPLNKICYYLALYFAKKGCTNKDSIGQKIKNPAIFNAQDVTTEKEALLRDYLKGIKPRLKMDGLQETLPPLSIETLLKEVERMKLEHEKILKNHKVYVPVPISLGIPLATVRCNILFYDPGSGDCGAYINCIEKSLLDDLGTLKAQAHARYYTSNPSSFSSSPPYASPIAEPTQPQFNSIHTPSTSTKSSRYSSLIPSGLFSRSNATAKPKEAPQSTSHSSLGVFQSQSHATNFGASSFASPQPAFAQTHNSNFGVHQSQGLSFGASSFASPPSTFPPNHSPNFGVHQPQGSSFGANSFAASQSAFPPSHGSSFGSPQSQSSSFEASATSQLTFPPSHGSSFISSQPQSLAANFGPQTPPQSFSTNSDPSAFSQNFNQVGLLDPIRTVERTPSRQSSFEFPPHYHPEQPHANAFTPQMLNSSSREFSDPSQNSMTPGLLASQSLFAHKSSGSPLQSPPQLQPHTPLKAGQQPTQSQFFNLTDQQPFEAAFSGLNVAEERHLEVSLQSPPPSTEEQGNAGGMAL